MEREGVISLGEAVMVPEGRNVVFVKEVFDGEVAVEARVRYRDGRAKALPTYLTSPSSLLGE